MNHSASETAIAWCSDPGIADAVAALFVAHADPSYISHSEFQIGRATAPGTWATDLRERIASFATRAATAPANVASSIGLATLMGGGTLVGFAFVAFAHEAAVPYAIVEDLLIVPGRRGEGIGARFLEWIVRECRARGMRRLFLESGAGNRRAHDFFAREGFRQTSIVMMRNL